MTPPASPHLPRRFDFLDLLCHGLAGLAPQDLFDLLFDRVEGRS